MWGFRSMHVDAEERLAVLQALNEKDEPIFKIKDDPHITRVGRLDYNTIAAALIEIFVEKLRREEGRL